MPAHSDSVSLDITDAERQLCQFLCDMPGAHKFRYSPEVARNLTRELFWSLIGGRDEYVPLLFKGQSTIPHDPNLREAQKAVEGVEYTEAARGRRCGHIIKTGELSYLCRTCGIDDTCCLCPRCFEKTNHVGHQIRLNPSGNGTGCCDCGDDEAWKTDMICGIHTAREGDPPIIPEAPNPVPESLRKSINMTIGRVLDYICDVISCSPEQLRSTKTRESIKVDESQSKLLLPNYPEDSPSNTDESEYCLIIWNDEKHTLRDVEDQISRACKKRSSDAHNHAIETDGIGRSLLVTSSDIDALLRMAKKLEEIRVTVTIRSARDTFREQMCATMVDWLQEISGCMVDQNSDLLIRTICEQILQPWREGSGAPHKFISEIDDEDKIASDLDRNHYLSSSLLHAFRQRFIEPSGDDMDGAETEDDSDGDLEVIEIEERFTDEDMGDDVDMHDADEDDEPAVAVTHLGGPPPPPIPPVQTLGVGPAVLGGEVPVGGGGGGDDEAMTTTTAAVPTVIQADVEITTDTSPPTTAAARVAATAARGRDATPSEVDSADPVIAAQEQPHIERIPKTPGYREKEKARPGRYWKQTPAEYLKNRDDPQPQNVFRRVRLDYLILFDLRMWKKVRNDLRNLYISTVVKIPEFKKVLGRRFAALYTTLAQLYLVGDREPDHSIISLSLQMFTTPSITKELVERANFLTNLFAILYTFLTTRQVNHPWEVFSNAVLAFESGSVTNRRMYHFYMDLKHLFQSTHVQKCLREEDRYLMQFLDLVKLHQGIGPNKRAIGEHVEYETDSWITASLVTREINRMAHQFSKAFRDLQPGDLKHLTKAIRITAKTLVLHCLGAERQRFQAAEIRHEARFKSVGDFEFDDSLQNAKIVNFVVERDPLSFHHALHYTLSWLIECGRMVPNKQLRELLSFEVDDFLKNDQHTLMGHKALHTPNFEQSSPEDLLLNLFDFPLRVCAWLSQIKTNMWVRNGISLRHQAATYRGVTMRDVCYQRDLHLLQTALVTCNPSKVLASIVDRFGQTKFMEGFFELKVESEEDNQHLDVVEDMIHLLINLLSDRIGLIPPEELASPLREIIRRDLLHVLCIKPLGYSEISQKVSDRYLETPEFIEVLHSLADFEFRDTPSNSGIFTLRPEFACEIDIFNSNFNRNQREDAEAQYRKTMAEKLGKRPEDIVYEPKLRPIKSGAFQDLAAATTTGMFAQIIYYCILYSLDFKDKTPSIQQSRIDVFLNTVLHLVLIAVAEEKTGDEAVPGAPSFIRTALEKRARSLYKENPEDNTIVGLLKVILRHQDYTACHAKVEVILRRMHQKQPALLDEVHKSLGIAEAAQDSAEAERERKKQAAADKRAKIMAQFKQQQNEFMGKQADIDWGSDIEDEDMDDTGAQGDATNVDRTWKFPSSSCLQCQEKTDDRKLFGTFALFNESRVVRTTDLQDPLIVCEVKDTPQSLDREYERKIPFGMAGKKVVPSNWSLSPDDGDVLVMGRSFSSQSAIPGPVSTSCGHLMHLSCFETYYEATRRRQAHQIARHHPENLHRQEFVCPLCKALANTFVPIVWKPREESYPGVLQTSTEFATFIDRESADPYYAENSGQPKKELNVHVQSLFTQQLSSLIAPLSENTVEAFTNLQPEEPASSDDVTTQPEIQAAFRVPVQVSNLRESSFPGTSGIMNDLFKVYSRMSRGLQVQDLNQGIHSSITDTSSTGPCFNDTLVRSVAFSIAAAEIQQRGLGPNTGGFVVENTVLTAGIPEITMSYLKILAETAQTYITISGLRAGSENPVATQFKWDAKYQLMQLFICEYPESNDTDSVPPVLSMDGFVLLTDYAYGLSEVHKVDIAHLIRLCYLIEVVRVVHRIRNSIPGDTWSSLVFNIPPDAPKEIQRFGRFCERLMSMTLDAKLPAGQLNTDADTVCKNQGFEQEGLRDLQGIYDMVKKYALIYLRKTTLLMHAKYGVNFSGFSATDVMADELTRLTEALKLPSFDEIVMAILPEAQSVGWAEQIDALVDGWVRHEISYPSYPVEDRSVDPDRIYDKPEARMFQPMGLAHPGIFELVGLPNQFDLLIDEATRRQCPTTGNEVQDATICLLCGDIFCGQSTCCLKSVKSDQGSSLSIGGTQQHMLKCQKTVGLFLNIRKCCTFYLFRRSGSFAQAPFLDAYGEADMGLRHGRQLFINLKRYDLLRQTFLSHGIPSFISRKLESEVNNGGWETI